MNWNYNRSAKILSTIKPPFHNHSRPKGSCVFDRTGVNVVMRVIVAIVFRQAGVTGGHSCPERTGTNPADACFLFRQTCNQFVQGLHACLHLHQSANPKTMSSFKSVSPAFSFFCRKKNRFCLNFHAYQMECFLKTLKRISISRRR